jgi:hypothetical protein
MPKQTRVNPAGELIATSARGTLMGNRGCLHDAAGRVIKRSARRAWVSCLLEFNGRRRTLMTPGHYTELFFLDEATALAAGHRPCSTCRREAARSFAEAWSIGHSSAERAGAEEIDKMLETQRAAGPTPLTTSITDFPDGVIVQQRLSARFLLLRNRSARRWSFDGYGPPVDAATITGPVDLVTPTGIVATLRAGYRPRIHSSASSL